MLDNNSKPFSNWFYFNNFVDEMFVNVMDVLLEAAWKQGNDVLLSEMFISNVCTADFLHRFLWIIYALEFDASAPCT